MGLKNFDKNQMLIGGWVAPPGSDNELNYITQKSFEDIKNSGVNVIYTSYNPITEFDYLQKASEFAEKSKVYLIVGADVLRDEKNDKQKIKRFLNFCSQSESIIGLNVYDEPGMNNFEMIKNVYNKYKEYFSELLFYINMLPMYATSSQIKGGWWTPEECESDSTDYYEFIEKYLQEIKPKVLSYDFYPFRHEKGVCDPRYFVNLSICSKLAKKYNVPLWNFAQVTSWQKDVIRNTTYSEIFFTVSTSIAYGVKGIQYFCYWTPCDNNGECFLSAMIDKNGNQTRSYHFVKEINKHLKAIQHYILNSEHIGIIPFGDNLTNIPAEDNIKSFGNLKSINSCGILTGCFKYNKKNMYYIVNTSVFETRYFSLEFKEKIKCDIIKGCHSTEFEGDLFEDVLHEGEGLLIIEK